MKKRNFILLSTICGGTIASVAVCRKTKRIKEAARKRGIHIPYGLYEAVIKRPLDILLSGIALVIFSPAMLMTALLVRVKLGRPVLFKQERSGKDAVPFTILKFRTMMDDRNEAGELLPDNVRLTEFGKMLRNTSIDELPELFNILKGDMSIIGPRPLAVQYIPYYTERERHRHDVRPGLTGLAQVNGRNSLSWEKKFQFDVEYVNHITFFKDFIIFFNTIKVVLFHNDIGERGVDTLVDFDKYRKEQKID